MAKLSFYGNNVNMSGAPSMVRALVGKSTTIYEGDVLVQTNLAALTSNNRLVVRPLTSSDTITTSNPPFGIALYDITTNSSGAIITQTYPITVDTNKGRWTSSLNSMGNLAPTDPTTGFVEIMVLSLTDGNEFYGVTQSNDTAGYYLLNRAVGINASAATQPISYTFDDDAAAANAPCMVYKIDQDSLLFNSASGGGGIAVRFIGTFDGAKTGSYFTT